MIVNVLKQIIASLTVVGIDTIKYEPGRIIQILHELQLSRDAVIASQQVNYPLIAVLMPIKEEIGDSYLTATFDRIVIACLTNPEISVIRRYEPGGTYDSILYPTYQAFLSGLANSLAINQTDVASLRHTKMDVPGLQPIGDGLNDYIDTIEILNLELQFNQITIC